MKTATLVTVGKEDDSVPPELVRMAHRLVPMSRYVVVPGAGHSVYYEKPDAFNTTVTSFLTEGDER